MASGPTDQPRLVEADRRYDKRGDVFSNLRQLPWGRARKNLQRQVQRDRDRDRDVRAALESERRAIAGVWSRGCLARGERLAESQQRGRKRSFAQVESKQA